MDKMPLLDTKPRTLAQARVLTDLADSSDDAVVSWRVFRIISEFVAGFTLLRRYGTAATIFGTARCKLDDALYKAAEELSELLSNAGFAIITGGGPGAMEAANKGAFKAGGQSLGLSIDLPLEQKRNEYTTETINFHYFFTRKVMLAYASEVYIYFPGGFGTLDEFFEILTLVQTKKISRVPILLYGREYWEPLVKWIETELYEKHRTVDKGDLELYHIVDSVEEAFEYILEQVDMGDNIAD